MTPTRKKREQHGFTLIEIIAVLVILGILAVVAVPKYFDMQNQSRIQAAKGLVAAAQSQLSLEYANNKLDNTNHPFTTTTDECNKVGVSGNANITCSGNLNSSVTITGNVEGQTNAGSWNNPEAAVAS